MFDLFDLGDIIDKFEIILATVKTCDIFTVNVFQAFGETSHKDNVELEISLIGCYR